MPGTPLITENIYHKKANQKIKPRRVTFGSRGTGGYYIDIYHESQPRLKRQCSINRDNFAGIETGYAGTVIVNGNFWNSKIPDAKYLAVILKNDTILFYTAKNGNFTNWEKQICSRLNHQSKWDIKLLEPQRRPSLSLQLMSSVISIIDKSETPKCLNWWRANDLRDVAIEDRRLLKLTNKTNDSIVFEPVDDHDLQGIFDKISDMCRENNIAIFYQPSPGCQARIPPAHVRPPSPDRTPSPEVAPPSSPVVRPRRNSYSDSNPAEEPAEPPKFMCRKSIKGRNLPITPAQVLPMTPAPVLPMNAPVPPPPDPHNFIIQPSRSSSDPSLYYNQMAIDSTYRRQYSENTGGTSGSLNQSGSIDDFYEGEYDYSSSVMNFVYHILCKREENTIPNLLQIGGITRRKLGLKLFNVSTPENGSWKDFSSVLCEMSVKDADYFSCLRQQQLCTQGLTETEMILKYWEYMATNCDFQYSNTFHYKCSRDDLIDLLRFVNREDLADLVVRSDVR